MCAVLDDDCFDVDCFDAQDPDADDCAHEWEFTGAEYGGDDESYHGEGRCYCRKCGTDGDA